jgi:tRNA 2-selenouridine synthase
MIESITITQWLDSTHRVPLIDVRTPAEFAHGHIPGALNLPLFSNEERIQVGTTFKQQGKEAAILLGFDLTGNKWSAFIQQALLLAPEKKIAVHCWRGGMRSGAMAWALNFYGFRVHVIAGGYKSFRHWSHQVFAINYKISLVGGMTGSGKTKVLHHLKKMGQQVIDLENIAGHQGSAYGSMNKLVQPTQEQFENNLAMELNLLDVNKTVWIEDESINIGRCQIPKAFWNQMLSASLIDLQVPAELRVKELCYEYGSLDKDFLIHSTERIRKRLGPEQCKLAVAAIQENRMEDFIRQVLVYYDKTYLKALSHRARSLIIGLVTNTIDPYANALKILALLPDNFLKTAGTEKTERPSIR